jgi:Domain of unknown function (DUF4333)
MNVSTANPTRARDEGRVRVRRSVEPTGNGRRARTAVRWPRLLALAVVVPAAASITGCGGSARLDPTRIEKAIEVSTAQQRHVVSIVVCPTGVKRQAGQQFACTATIASGQQFRFVVTEKDDKGNVHYQAVAPQR